MNNTNIDRVKAYNDLASIRAQMALLNLTRPLLADDEDATLSDKTVRELCNKARSLHMQVASNLPNYFVPCTEHGEELFLFEDLFNLNPNQMNKAKVSEFAIEVRKFKHVFKVEEVHGDNSCTAVDCYINPMNIFSTSYSVDSANLLVKFMDGSIISIIKPEVDL